MTKILIFLMLPLILAFAPVQKKKIVQKGKPVEKGKLIEVSSVKTNAGLISGKTTDDQIVKVFMGIPFAAPPVGDLRWKNPQPVKPWDGIRACTAPPASAMQAPPKPFMC
jgi:para-nitrobenzyl esterase